MLNFITIYFFVLSSLYDNYPKLTLAPRSQIARKKKKNTDNTMCIPNKNNPD